MRLLVRFLLLLNLLTYSCAALALDPALDISQYAHKSWKTRDGFPAGALESIVQTTDGYLWLGTTAGLYRFDGVRHSPWPAAAGDPVTNGVIYSLLAAQDGSLWIGSGHGLSRWADGRVTHYEELAGFQVDSLLQDHEGTIWAAGKAIPETKLCAIRSTAVHCDSMTAEAISLYEDSQQTLWIGTGTGLWRWTPRPSTFYPVSGPTPFVTAVIEAKPGEILAGTAHGVHRIVDTGLDLPATFFDGLVRRLMRDRDGGLWIGTNQGLLHVHEGRIDSYTRSDGLTGDAVTSLYEDQEGDIWVGTAEGLDQFRRYAISTISTSAEGLRGMPLATLAAADDSIWISAGTGGLIRWKDGEAAIYRTRATVPVGAGNKPGALRPRAREIIDPGLPGEIIGSLALDSEGRIWAAGVQALSVLSEKHFSRRFDLGEGYIYAVMPDRAESLWISHTAQGLIHIVGPRIADRIGWDRFGSRGYAVSLLPDPGGGGIWLGFRRGGVAYFANGQEHIYDRQDGLGAGQVRDFFLDKQGALWAATEGGLSRVNNGLVQTLSTKNGLPCPVVHWVIEDDIRSFWLGTSCGVVRIAERELDQWASGALAAVHPALFDSTDGVRSEYAASDCGPAVTKAPDGKLWFKVADGISIIDPRHLFANPLPPPVHVEQIIADRKSYDASSLSMPLRLPPQPRDLEFDYTALSLVAPEKMQFRYKLEGHDRGWQSVGNRRQAFYNDLPPGNYRFRVIASNNSGVWNEKGATLDFSIAPAYWQTTWFRALCLVAFAGLLWALYLLRVRQVTRNFERTLDARVAERTRIARDLHDTLLQSFNAVLLHFSTVARLFGSQPDEARKVLDNGIAQARRAIREGREAVQGLRSSTEEPNDLAQAISRLAEDLSRSTSSPEPSSGNLPQPIGIQVRVEGESRRLHPIIRDEMYRIAAEALRNALQHSQAKQIEVELHYDLRQFRLQVRDDGRGIEQELLATGGREGHFGLKGMRERAQLAGGKLTVWSAPGSGTEVEVNIPASRAYASARSGYRRDSG